MMNRDKHRTFELNSIDIFIIAFTVICLFTVIFRSFAVKDELSPKDMKEYRVSFVADNVRSSSVKYLIEGHILRTKSGNKIIGTLLDKSPHTSTKREYIDNGEIVYPESEELENFHDITRFSVKGNLSVVGKMTERGLFLESGERLLIGKEFLVVSEFIEISIRITSIDPIQ